MNVCLKLKKKSNIIIELTFLKELILIKQMHHNSEMFVTIVIFLNYSFKFKPNICNRRHDLLMMSINISDIAILTTKDSHYFCIINLNRKIEAMNLFENTDLTKKLEHYKI